MSLNLKRMLCTMLALIMMLSCMSTAAFATEVDVPADGDEDFNVDFGDLAGISAPATTVTEITDSGYDYALNFATAAFTDEQSNNFGPWRTDYQVSFNKDVTLNDAENPQVTLALRSANIPELVDWMNVPLAATELKAGETFNVMKYIFETLSGGSYDTTYYDVRDAFNNLDVAITVDPDFLKDNTDLETTVRLYGYDLTDPTKYVSFGQTHAFSAPELPTATTERINKDDLTFAMNFKADEVTDSQLAYYGDWYADFEITVNKTATYDANGTGDGYLAGQYDGKWESWNGEWVYVPYNKAVTLEANQTLKIMAFAAELMGEPGLKYTYKEVYEVVKDFDCGIYFTPEFLAANPDLEVKLELKMYNPDDETECYTIGDTHIFTIPELPGATVTDIEKDELTFALNFLAQTPSPEQLAYYGEWFTDFELTVNKQTTFNADGSADGFLSGQYDFVGDDWINVPPSDVKLEANKPLKIMAYAAELLGEEGLKFTYADIMELVKDFDCGVYLSPAFLAANPDLVITLELKMYHPDNEEICAVIGQTYTFSISESVAMNTTTNVLYSDVSDGLDEAKSGETVVLLKDATDKNVWVNEGSILDLNGFTLTANYVSSFGHVVDNSEDNTGVLVVAATKLMLQTNNKQLTIKTDKGYQFVEIIGFNSKMISAEKYAFQPLFEEDAHELLKNGVAVTGVSIQVVVTWSSGTEDTDSRTFQYGDTFVTGYVNSYNRSTGKYSKMFTLTLVDAEAYENLTCTAKVVSDTKVEFTA